MGIPATATATMAEVLENHCRRGHRVEYLNAMEAAIEKAKSLRKEGVDISYWKYSDIVSRNVLLHGPRGGSSEVRTAQPIKSWYKGVWFRHDTRI